MTPRARRPPREAAPPGPQPARAVAGDRRQGQRAGEPGRARARTCSTTSARARPSSPRRSSGCPARSARPRARAARGARAGRGARARRREELRPARARAQPGAGRGAPAAARRRRRSCATTCARSCARPRRSAPTCARPSRDLEPATRRPGPHRQGPQLRRQRARLQPARAGGGLPLLDLLVHPQRELDPLDRGRARRDLARARDGRLLDRSAQLLSTNPALAPLAAAPASAPTQPPPAGRRRGGRTDAEASADRRASSR